MIEEGKTFPLKNLLSDDNLLQNLSPTCNISSPDSNFSTNLKIAPNDFLNQIQAPIFTVCNRKHLIENALDIVNNLYDIKEVKKSGGVKLCITDEKFSTNEEYQEIQEYVNNKQVELPVIIQVIEHLKKAQEFQKEFKGFTLQNFEYFSRYYEFFYKYQTLSDTAQYSKLIQNEFEYWSLVDNALPKYQKTSVRMVQDLSSKCQKNYYIVNN